MCVIFHCPSVQQGWCRPAEQQVVAGVPRAVNGVRFLIEINFLFPSLLLPQPGAVLLFWFSARASIWMRFEFPLWGWMAADYYAAGVNASRRLIASGSCAFDRRPLLFKAAWDFSPFIACFVFRLHQLNLSRVRGKNLCRWPVEFLVSDFKSKCFYMATVKK